MIQLKGCKKCGGDLFPDLYDEKVCLQCGWSPNTTAVVVRVGEVATVIDLET